MIDGRSIALVGNPNSGKTSLFNALTGLRQKTGNYPGVTVERKEGYCFSQHGHRLRLLDLPGSYSLQARSPDEVIMTSALLGRLAGEPLPDVILCCVDASNLERNLFLVTQILELGRPVVIALNMIDLAQRRGLRIDTTRLATVLWVPVVACSAHTGEGLLELRLTLSRSDLPAASGRISSPSLFSEAVADLATALGGRPPAMARAEIALHLGAVEGDLTLPTALITRIRLWRQRLDRETPGWRSSLITGRYAFIGDVVRDCVKRFNPHQPSTSERVDRVLLHPVGGFAMLLAVLGALFFCIFWLAAPAMEAIDAAFAWLGSAVGGLLPTGQVRALAVEGVVGGIGAVVIFLPQILLLSLFIALLEASGYMARAAFILDRLMSRVGLHGRSFIPLLSSYACAVPGILATRTIESAKDRLATILVAPLMTCSARLPVYLIIIAAMLPAGSALTKALLLLGLYVAGTGAALLTALLFKRTLLRGRAPSHVMELPPYRIPQLRSVALELYDKAGAFLLRAGTIIFALSVILWFLLNYPRLPDALPDDNPPVATAFQAADGAVVAHQASNEVAVAAEFADDPHSRQLAHSFAGRFGSLIEPLFRPLGFDWKITVAVLASFAAREVFVSTLSIAYAAGDSEDDPAGLLETLQRQRRPDGNPVFDVPTCLSILLFFAFALQCISTIAVVRRETASWRWPAIQFAYMLALAWLAGAAVHALASAVV
jgi:ferrous iron transport protein B